MHPPPTWQVIGLGNLGARYADAAASAGCTVLRHPRADSSIPETSPTTTTVLIGVGEADLPAAIQRVPTSLRHAIVLVQNDTFLADALALGVSTPTFCAVWSQHKAGQPTVVGRATGVWGPQTDAVLAVHEHMDVPAVAIAGPYEPNNELVAKAAFILVINALGVAFGGTVAEAVQRDPALTSAVILDALLVSGVRCRASLEVAFDPGAAHGRVRAALEAMGTMQAAGRTAGSRLAAALAAASTHQLAVPGLAKLAAMRA